MVLRGHSIGGKFTVTLFSTVVHCLWVERWFFLLRSQSEIDLKCRLRFFFQGSIWKRFFCPSNKFRKWAYCAGKSQLVDSEKKFNLPFLSKLRPMLFTKLVKSFKMSTPTWCTNSSGQKYIPYWSKEMDLWSGFLVILPTHIETLNKFHSKSGLGFWGNASQTSKTEVLQTPSAIEVSLGQGVQ